MSVIPNIELIVRRNGIDISDKVAGASTTLQIGNISRSWEIELLEPIPAQPTDLWTVIRRIAGYSQTWCDNTVATNMVYDDAIDDDGSNVGRLRLTTRVSGSAADQAAQDIMLYCIPKTLVFVNSNWLSVKYPTAKLENDILVYGSSIGPFALPNTRIYDPRLPGREYSDTDFKCIVGTNSHHDIARYLASRVGFSIEISTPDVQLINTLTITSGTTWFDAISGLFRSLWLPHIEVIGRAIYVHDINAGETSTPDVSITIENDAIVAVNIKQSKLSEPPIDHLIITGRKTTDTTILLPEEPDYTPVELSEIELAADTEVVANIDSSSMVDLKVMDEYYGEFGTPDDKFRPDGVRDQIKTIQFYTDQSGGKPRRIPISETLKTYDTSGQEVARKIIEYKYGKGYVPVRTIEKDYVLTNLPGSATKALELILCKTTKHLHFRKPLNLALTSEIIEGLVLYERVEIDSTEYKTDPIVLADALRLDTSRSIIDDDPDTKQDVLEMTISEKTSYISRTHDDLLIKTDITHDRLTGHTRSNSQFLENPIRDRHSLKSDHIFRKEYFHGPGKMIGGYGPCYHPPRTIHHDDIATEALADEVAARFFRRKAAAKNHEISITVPTPMPVDSVATAVTIPDFHVVTNGQQTIVSGGTYVLRSYSESLRYEDMGNNILQLKCESKLSLRERY